MSDNIDHFFMIYRKTVKKINKIKILIIAYWIGALTYGAAAIIMIFPNLRGFVLGSENTFITPEYRYALGMGAALMLGWTMLLIYGYI